MPVDRPTFSESWYRVAELKPRLRGSVQVHRQQFRGQMWHVLQDPSNNQFFRLNEAAYRFVALLDGKRNVAGVWKICNEQLGDNAPTQGEAIQLLGQLYSSNLLQAELAPDAEGLFNRYRKRVGREVRSYLTNLLFIRIPLLDPDRFLDAWVGLFGKLFTWYGAILWAILLSVGGYFALSNYEQLANQTRDLINQQNLAANLPLMYLSFALIKAIHEFGHAFACKKFGKATGTGGEVHVMGIMFMVFTPIPYVDASSSWAFRQKWHRFIVGAAGMIVEMAVAAIAAVIWALTPDGSTVHALAYNVMIIGSVTTLLFNANPLLRYDGYYMLSDLLEIPNLAQRSKDYLYYLVKKYVWNVRNPRNPAHTAGERGWFVFYGIASTIYRTIVVAAILLFIMNQLFMLGVLLALASAVAWVLVPLGKFIHYLVANNELSRVRPRAMATTALFIVVLIGSLGLIPYPDRCRMEGIVEPLEMQVVYARGDGFVKSVLPSGRQVQAGTDVLVEARNEETQAYLQLLEADLEGFQAKRRLAQASGELAAAGYFEQALRAQEQHIANMKERLSELKLLAPISGLWVTPSSDRLVNTFLSREQQVGLVISEKMIIRAVAPQEIAARLKAEAIPEEQFRRVEVRVMGRAESKFDGRVFKFYPAGSERLPSAALSYQVGGSQATDPSDKYGTKAATKFLEVQIEPITSPGQPAVRLLAGQRVVVRMEMPAKPLMSQWWRSLLQLLQQKIQI